MADILAAFDELEKKENSKKPLKSTNKKFVNPLKSSGSQRTGRTQTRPQSSGNSLVPPSSNRSPSVTPSVISNRRISFVAPEVPHSTQRRLRIPTKTASLASGFVWDPKLTKYGVSEKEWEKFTEDILRAAALPKRAKIMWSLVKQDVIDKIKRDLDFNGDVKTELKEWSAHFRQKGFTVGLELPGKVKEREDETFEERQLAESYAKFFRVVITPNAERSASIYSRNSSLTRSITGEGLANRTTPDASDDDDGDDDEIDEVGKPGGTQ
ncbi:uncharacterized protein RAG0_04435 [Rhynchosporium agropyri]|uniref:Uncharacterized protein n=2 Tax=Rhynchosporium TaxID=38037 RepID=A0A1E1K8V7_9HELO|nr:uncharacterized protein RAG0_04435 [Rhynchosporium agropyri]CZT01547.1 uncharacterized protein RCO7_02129 [Rhynchosporium commune]